MSGSVALSFSPYLTANIGETRGGGRSVAFSGSLTVQNATSSFGVYRVRLTEGLHANNQGGFGVALSIQSLMVNAGASSTLNFTVTASSNTSSPEGSFNEWREYRIILERRNASNEINYPIFEYPFVIRFIASRYVLPSAGTPVGTGNLSGLSYIDNGSYLAVKPYNWDITHGPTRGVHLRTSSNFLSGNAPSFFFTSSGEYRGYAIVSTGETIRSGGVAVTAGDENASVSTVGEGVWTATAKTQYGGSETGIIDETDDPPGGGDVDTTEVVAALGVTIYVVYGCAFAVVSAFVLESLFRHA